jgi:hypothetical protein
VKTEYNDASTQLSPQTRSGKTQECYSLLASLFVAGMKGTLVTLFYQVMAFCSFHIGKPQVANWGADFTWKR